MSATKEYKEEDSGRFFGELFELYNAVMLTGCTGILLLLRPLAAFMFRKGFYEAWIMVPPLLISVIFGALEGYLGSICLAYKDGRSMGIATGTGAVVNIILNAVTISAYGAVGAAFATLISYFTMFAIAYALTVKHIRLEVDIKKNAVGYILVLIAGGVTMYGVKSESAEYAACAACALILLILVFIYRAQAAYALKRAKMLVAGRTGS